MFVFLLALLLVSAPNLRCFALPFPGQGQIFPGNCPMGFYADGSCAILHLCIDPHERCINGICCQPMDVMAPFGYNAGMPLPAMFHGGIGSAIGLGPYGNCIDLEESCLQFVHLCNNPSVRDVCMRTCGLCLGMGGVGAHFNPYAYGGILAGKK